MLQVSFFNYLIVIFIYLDFFLILVSTPYYSSGYNNITSLAVVGTGDLWACDSRQAIAYVAGGKKRY